MVLVWASWSNVPRHCLGASMDQDHLQQPAVWVVLTHFAASPTAPEVLGTRAVSHWFDMCV